MRTLYFEQITDNRFDSDIAGTIRDRKRQIKTLLSSMDGVHVAHDVERKLSWPDGTEQYRCRFWVQKDTRRTTWNNIYAAVNSVKAVPYKFVDSKEI